MRTASQAGPFRILAVNPGSTSTKAALFLDEELAAEAEILHERAELAAFARTADQLEFRKKAVVAALPEAFDSSRSLDAVVGRGGLLAPLPGGTYLANARMLAELERAERGDHACNLGAPLAAAFAAEAGCPAFVVDPPVTDEMEDVARLTGLPEIRRRSVFHALSQRGAARKAARQLGLEYEKENFLAVHLGGGVSIGAHRRGRIVDVINALDGEGPFSPERAGGLPGVSLLRLVEEGVWDPRELRGKLLTSSGLVAHLGTNDLRRVEAMIEGGDARARLVFEALAYNVAKQTASLAPALVGDGEGRGMDGREGRLVSAVVLTGGMARSVRLVAALTRLLRFLGPVVAVTGLEEMPALAAGALRVLRGQVEPQRYPGAARRTGGLGEETMTGSSGRYICLMPDCGYVYDPLAGEPDLGVAPGTAFADLPDAFRCPVCGAGKNAFAPLRDGVRDKNGQDA